MSPSKKRKQNGVSFEASPMINFNEDINYKHSHCSVIALRDVMCFYIILLMIFGFAAVGAGIWSFLTNFPYKSLLLTQCFEVVCWSSVISGLILLLIILIIGCLAIYHDSICSLYLFSFGLMIVFLIHICASWSSFLCHYKIKEELPNFFWHSMSNKYNKNSVATAVTDTLQKEFRCCGSESHIDWMRNGAVKNISLPESCCISAMHGCATRYHPSNIFYRGCRQEFQDRTNWFLHLIGTLGLGLCCFEIFGVIVSCMFAHSLKDAKIKIRRSSWS